MTKPRIVLLVSALAITGGVALVDGQSAPPVETGIKFVRDSEEYATLTRQVYRLAAEAATRAGQAFGTRPWAVVLDIDETALDNSTYQLDRATYRLPFDNESWNAWVIRREAAAVPGVADFVAAARRAGARVAWISNRDAANEKVGPATKANLQSFGMWNENDRFCLQDAPSHTKKSRRAELVSGQGRCAWAGQPVAIGVFVGDQMGDFPDAEEKIAGTGTDASFGHTNFILPNPMYGGWTTKVTRVR